MAPISISIGIDMTSLGSSTALASTIIPVILYFGQSNADGQTNLSQVPDALQGRFVRIRVPNRDPGFDDEGVLRDLVVIKNGVTIGDDTGPYSTGSETAVTHAANIPQIGAAAELALIEREIAGTLFYDREEVFVAKWGESGHGIARFHPSDELSTSTTPADNIDFRNIASYVNPRVAEYAAAGKSLAPQFLLWSQGEWDSGDGSPSVEEYDGRLNGFRAYMRGRWNDDTMPFIAVMVKEISNGADINDAIRRNCKWEVVGAADGSITLTDLTGTDDDTYRDPNSFIIDTLSASALAAMDGTPAHPWGPNTDLHYSATAQLYIGRVALKILSQIYGTYAGGLRGETIIDRLQPMFVMGPTLTGTAPTSLTYDVKCSDGGTLYYALYSSLQPGIPYATIIAGTGAVAYGTKAVTARENAQTFDTYSIADLESETQYHKYYFYENAAGDRTPIGLDTRTTSAAGAGSGTLAIQDTDADSLTTLSQITSTTSNTPAKPTGANRLLVFIGLSDGGLPTQVSWNGIVGSVVEGSETGHSFGPYVGVYEIDVTAVEDETAAEISVTKNDANKRGALAWAWMSGGGDTSTWTVVAFNTGTGAVTSIVDEVTPSTDDGFIFAFVAKRGNDATTFTAVGGGSVVESHATDGSVVSTFPRIALVQHTNTSTDPQEHGASDSESDRAAVVVLHIPFSGGAGGLEPLIDDEGQEVIDDEDEVVVV